MGISELLENLTNCRGVTCDGLASHPVGVEILLALHAMKAGFKAPAAYESVWLQGFTSLLKGYHRIALLGLNLD